MKSQISISEDHLSPPVEFAETDRVEADSVTAKPLGSADRRAIRRGLDRRKRPRPLNERKIKYWEVEPDGNRSRPYQLCKRLADIIGAVGLLVVLSPVMLVVFVVLTITTKGKPIFKQQRVGVCGKLFWMYKFRTMVVNADQIQKEVVNEKSGPVFKNKKDPRITTLGRFLRKSSIDETPQIFNVLKGEMSLVGPRPPIESEVMNYENWQLRRLSIKPGLTCIWQVSGRCEIEFEDWVRLDLRYVNDQDLFQDLMLLAKTPKSVITGKGAY